MKITRNVSQIGDGNQNPSHKKSQYQIQYRYK